MAFSETHLEPSETSHTKPFTKITNCCLLVIFTKKLMIDWVLNKFWKLIQTKLLFLEIF